MNRQPYTIGRNLIFACENPDFYIGGLLMHKLKEGG
jgi:hypothetical protein